jgi:hypothetical protein
MTRDEILNTPAGRELDALVAEKVMELKVDYEFSDVLEPRVPFLVDKYDEWGYLPNYSTDIAAAWEVVEFLRRKFWSTNIVCWDYSVKWVVTCEYRTGHGEPKKTLYADADTAPLAICRAALLAVMGE